MREEKTGRFRFRMQPETPRNARTSAAVTNHAFVMASYEVVQKPSVRGHWALEFLCQVSQSL